MDSLEETIRISKMLQEITRVIESFNGVLISIELNPSYKKWISGSNKG